MPRRIPPLHVLAFALLLPLLAFDFPHPAAAASGAAPPPARWASWLEEVAPLVTPEERQAFLSLTGDPEREVFVERFWQVRDPYPQTVRNELEERWQRLVSEARSRYGRLDDARSRVLLLNGEPSAAFEASCGPGQAPLEVWLYDRVQRIRSKLVVLFQKRGGRDPVRLWRPEPAGIRELSVSAPERCANGDQLARAAMWVRLAGKGYDGLLARALEPPRPATEDWLAGFRDPGRDLEPGLAGATAGGSTLPADLDFSFAGETAGRTIVRGRLAVPAGEVGCLGAPSCDFLLTGRVDGGASPPESFRYRLSVPPPAAGEGTVEVPFERRLAPGEYRVELQLEGLNAGRSFRAERDLAVPRLLLAGPGTPEAPSLRLAGPDGLLAGPVRFEAVAAGPVAKVAFLLDGRPLLTKTRPPFAVELDLGAAPRPHAVRAEALDASGRTVASDEREVNAGAQRFAVRLRQPLARAVDGRIEASAEVEAPAGRAVESLELFVGDRRVATLYQPPWALPLPAPQETSYVRAVAHLADGTTAEDVAVLGAPDYGAVVDVRWVELYAGVVGRDGRPVRDLGRDAFRLAEDGVPQQVRRFAAVGDLPLQVALLMDTSASMRDRLEATRAAARAFLRQAVRPGDRVALLRFDRAPRVEVPLTGDLAALEHGLDALSALDRTALYDSLVYGLDYLTGARGQRALLLLSDGEDRSSRFGFDQALECARRAGIAVYAIGLGLPRGEPRRRLARIAAETGGRSFFLDGPEGLPAAYAEIQEDLRSQYLLAYQSSNTGEGAGFRQVRLDLAPGLEGRTISGYYP